MLRSCSNKESNCCANCCRASALSMMQSIILWCRATMASNDAFHSSRCCCANSEVANSWSVMPPKALTTTTTSPCCASFSTICFRLRILSTEPTDVPPNFNTFMKNTFKLGMMLPPKSTMQKYELLRASPTKRARDCEGVAIFG